MLGTILTIFQIIGDALVGVCFIRNLFATIISVSLTYWIEGESLLPHCTDQPVLIMSYRRRPEQHDHHVSRPRLRIVRHHCPYDHLRETGETVDGGAAQENDCSTIRKPGLKEWMFFFFIIFFLDINSKLAADCTCRNVDNVLMNSMLLLLARQIHMLRLGGAVGGVRYGSEDSEVNAMI